jgi:hypothetical protein
VIARLIAVAAGVWLMFAPTVIGYGDPAEANDRIFGPIGAALAFVAIWEVIRPLRWGTLPVGVWLILAPMVLGYDVAGAYLSSIGAGLVMVATAFFGGEIKNEYGGGWSSLLPGRDVPADTESPR